MSRKNKGEFVKYRPDRDWWGVAEYVNGQLHWRVSSLGSEQKAKVALAKRILEQGKRDEDSVTIGELMAYYLDHRAPKLANPENAVYFHDRLAPFWSTKKLEDLTQVNIRAYEIFANEQFAAYQIENKAKEIRPITSGAVRRHLEHLRACIGFAHKDKVITTLPHIELPEKGKPKERWLTRDEAARLLWASRQLRYAKTYLPRFIRIALRTGARKTKILELRGNQIDLTNMCVNYTGGNRIKRTAKAPIFDKQIPYFRAIKQKTGIGRLITSYGKPINNIEKSFREARDLAGLGEDVTINTLRHTFASWLKQDGASVSDIAEALGHTTTTMTDRTYAHMGDGYIQKLRKVGR